MAETTVKAKPDTIVMIHGLWMTPRSWEHWKERYEARGYTVHTPAWPGFEVEVEALNADPSPMKDLRAETVIDAYEAFINELGWRPDHHGSLPGRRDHPGAVEPRSRKRGRRGVRGDRQGDPRPAVVNIKGSRTGAEPLQTRRPGADFGEGVPLRLREHDERGGVQARSTSATAVPAASDVLADIALANLHRNPPTEVDFAKQGRIPLLFIGLGEDHVVPPKATMHNERKYDDSVSITEYKEFEGRPHFPGAPGWEEVADFAIDWAERHAGLTVSEHAAAKDPVSGGG